MDQNYNEGNRFQNQTLVFYQISIVLGTQNQFEKISFHYQPLKELLAMFHNQTLYFPHGVATRHKWSKARLILSVLLTKITGKKWTCPSGFVCVSLKYTRIGKSGHHSSQFTNVEYLQQIDRSVAFFYPLTAGMKQPVLTSNDSFLRQTHFPLIPQAALLFLPPMITNINILIKQRNLWGTAKSNWVEQIFFEV